MNIKNLVTASKNWKLNATAAAQKKFDGSFTDQSTTLTQWKFDAASQRHLMAPGSTDVCTMFNIIFSYRAATNILTKIRNFRDLRTCHKGPKSDQKGT